MKVKVACVNPRTQRADSEYLNVENALKYVDQASDLGAQLICFPEGYPGPCTGPSDFGAKIAGDFLDLLCKKARERRVYITASSVEPNPSFQGTFYVSIKLISKDGSIVLNYRRVQPDEPKLNHRLYGGRMNIAPGEELPVAKTEIGSIGILGCMEIWIPELSRILMLKGAELIMAPMNAGGRRHRVRGAYTWDTWYHIAKARAAENLFFIIIPVNTYADSERGPDGMISVCYSFSLGDS